MSATNRSRLNCCPYKCAQSHIFAVAPVAQSDADAAAASDASRQPAVLADPAGMILAERAAADAMEMIQ